MTIWLVDEFGHGGIGRYAVDVANLLGDERGVVVATSALGPVEGQRAGTSTEWFPRLAETTLGRGLGGVVGLLRAARSVRRGDIAWIPLGVRPSFELALAAVLRGRGATLVVTVHNRGPHGRGESPTVVRAARLASAVVVHTGAIEQWAVGHDLRAARLPFPPPDISRVSDPLLTRESLGIPPERIVVSMLGYLHHYKGVDVLVDALNRARERIPHLPVHVLLAGRLPHSGRVLAAVEAAAENPHLTLRAGWLEETEMSALLELTDVVALPYRDIDNSGSGSLARSRGVPAIASDLPGLRDIFGDAAVYVPCEDPGSLADLLVRLPELLPGLRERAGEVRSEDDLSLAYQAFVDGLTASG